MKVLHVCKFQADKASRLVMERTWDEGDVMDLSENSAHKLGYVELFRIVRSRRYDIFLFHMQSSLPYLFWSLICRFFLGGDIRFVYDIHDINIKPKLYFNYVGFRYYIFYILEFFAFLFCDSVMTVSKGLSKLYFQRYRKSPGVVYNIPIFSNPLPFTNSDKQGGMVYFGLINSVRLPGYLLEAIQLANVVLDVYGIVDDPDPIFLTKLQCLERNGFLRFKGTYSPKNLMFLQAYTLSVLIFDSDSLNIRYCLPNKLFQSAALGLNCLVSDNLREIVLRLGKSEEFIKISPRDPVRLAEILLIGSGSCSRSGVLALIATMQKKSREIYFSLISRRLLE